MINPLDFVEKRTVLVVDDTPDNLAVLSGILKDQYRVKIAPDGEKALAICHSDTPPDIVLLDIMMPGMDGFEVMRRLRAEPRTREIPVIFVTAMTDAADEQAGLELGAVDYLTKPVKPAVVLTRIKNHLALSERTTMLRELSAKLSRYLPPQVYQMIFKGVQDTSIHAKRKKLTIFFSDIKDFTATTADLEPEDLTYLLNKYFEEMSKIALEYGATIDKFVGDAMLMFFGDPETQGVKEDALRCVRMAIAMQRRMTDLQALWRDKGFEHPLRMRSGINTGFCNVGNFGSALRMDYTVIGGEVNLAARLEQAGDPDGILVSFETYALVREEIDAEERPPIALKGIPGGVRAFAVKGILDGVEAERRFVQKIRPGLRAVLDLDRLSPASRDEAIDDLEDLIGRIRQVG
ncbi:MAG: adenylate/guanylate cyclase domain-containing protein [Sulfurisoma sp.]|nr:adenylate/guanylate cyclase domain-containing protein [Sulfurisoma sp.]